MGEYKLPLRLWGYASAFNNRDAVNDIVLRGAFKHTIQDYKDRGKAIPVLWHHDSSCPVGIVKTIKETAFGLYTGLELFHEISKVNDIKKYLTSNVQLGLSIGYRVKEVCYENAEATRIIKRCDLIEISITIIPANDLTLIEKVRGL